jgi:Ca2+-binding EF-hand superfamily protein
MRTPLLLLTLLALAAPLHAAGPNHATPLVFSVHDLDRDGYLSREEYAALRTQCQERRRETGSSRCALLDFETLDADHNGRISEDELVETLGRRYRGGRNSPSPFKE